MQIFVLNYLLQGVFFLSENTWLLLSVLTGHMGGSGTVAYLAVCKWGFSLSSMIVVKS